MRRSSLVLTLAFVAAYEGPAEVYTMPLAGGPPVRRTFDGGGARVVGFAPDGSVLYATRRFSTLPDTQLFRLDLADGKRYRLSEGAWNDKDAIFSPDGKRLYFTSVIVSTPEQRAAWLADVRAKAAALFPKE